MGFDAHHANTRAKYTTSAQYAQDAPPRSALLTSEQEAPERWPSLYLGYVRQMVTISNSKIKSIIAQMASL